jgi:DNA (cytosine-5)-methyltransferase 1
VNAARRKADEPAPTILFGHDAATAGWVRERPATTVACDARIAPAGHHTRQMQDAIRITVPEAATLQGFPPEYPFQGSRTKQFEQVGNAIPPPLALAILRQLVD